MLASTSMVSGWRKRAGKREDAVGAAVPGELLQVRRGDDEGVEVDLLGGDLSGDGRVSRIIATLSLPWSSAARKFGGEHQLRGVPVGRKVAPKISLNLAAHL